MTLEAARAAYPAARKAYIAGTMSPAEFQGVLAELKRLENQKRGA